MAAYVGANDAKLTFLMLYCSEKKIEFSRWSFRGKFYEKKSKKPYFPETSPPARCAKTLVDLNQFMIKCHRSNRPYGASVYFLMFCSGGESAEVFAKKPKNPCILVSLPP